MAYKSRAPIEIRARWLQVIVWVMVVPAIWVTVAVALFHEPIAQAAFEGIFFAIFWGAFLLFQQRRATQRTNGPA